MDPWKSKKDPYLSSVSPAYNMDDNKNLSDGETPQLFMFDSDLDTIDTEIIIRDHHQKRGIIVGNSRNYNDVQQGINALDEGDILDTINDNYEFLNESEQITNYHTDNNIPYKFIIEKCERSKNIPYMVKDKFLVTKSKVEVNIKVEGARLGHSVKMFMRFKEKSNHNEPVLSCERHKKEFERTPNPDATFYLCTSNDDYPSEINYRNEGGHHAAFITVSKKDFNFSIIFTCWNSCSVPRKPSRKEEMVIKLYDLHTGKELHEDVFQVRVSQNIVRDFNHHFMDGNEKNTIKRKRTPSGKRGLQKAIKLENTEDQFEESGESLSSSLDLLDSPPTTRWFKVQLDEEMHYVMKIILRSKGYMIIPVDDDDDDALSFSPPSLPHTPRY